MVLRGDKKPFLGGRFLRQRTRMGMCQNRGIRLLSGVFGCPSSQRRKGYPSKTHRASLNKQQQRRTGKTACLEQVVDLRNPSIDACVFSRRRELHGTNTPYLYDIVPLTPSCSVVPFFPFFRTGFPLNLTNQNKDALFSPGNPRTGHLRTILDRC